MWLLETPQNNTTHVESVDQPAFTTDYRLVKFTSSYKCTGTIKTKTKSIFKNLLHFIEPEAFL